MAVQPAQRTNWLFGGVYGALLSSGLLVGGYDPTNPTPIDTALWIAITMLTTVVARGFAQHVSTHTADGPSFWRNLGGKIGAGWPLFAGCLPTVVLLLVIGYTHLAESWYTLLFGMLVNMAQLLVWGMAAARTGGYRWVSSVAIGVGHAALGAVIIIVTAFVK